MSREITSIKIRNFRQYHNVDLSFPQEKNSNLIVILGNNRFGKTNLLNAILWCLYGEEGIIQDNGQKNDLLIKNERYNQEKAAVSITLKDKSEGVIIVINREEDYFSITKKDASSRKFVPLNEVEAEREIRGILPKTVRKLFLFKGEFLDNFFDEGGSDYLKETIKNVSKIKRLERIVEVLRILEVDYRRTIEKQNKNNDELTKVSMKLERYDLVIDKNKKKINDLNSQIKLAKNNIENIDKSLMQLNQENINKLMSDDKELNGRKENIIDKIARDKKEILRLFLSDVSYWFLYDGIINVHNKLEKLIKAGLIPPPIKSSLIQKILHDKICICGKNIDPEMRKNLEVLMAKYPENDKLEKVYELNLSLDTDTKRFNRAYKRIKDLISSVCEDENNLKITKKQIDDVSEKLKGLDKDNIYKLAAQKQILQREIDEKDADRVQAQSDLKFNEENRKDASNLFHQFLSRSKVSEALSNKLSKCTTLKEKTEKLSSLILNKISKDLNDKTLAYFKEIFWQNYKYIDYSIKINEDFDIQVLSPEENNMIYLLSTGEKKVLALSFMAALSDFYGFDFPIVIDAPFTALQKEVTTNMLNTIINLSKRKQIIILTIPHDSSVMQVLNNSSSKKYVMEKDKNDNTLIKEMKA